MRECVNIDELYWFVIVGWNGVDSDGVLLVVWERVCAYYIRSSGYHWIVDNTQYYVLDILLLLYVILRCHIQLLEIKVSLFCHIYLDLLLHNQFQVIQTHLRQTLRSLLPERLDRPTQILLQAHHSLLHDQLHHFYCPSVRPRLHSHIQVDMGHLDIHDCPGVLWRVIHLSFIHAFRALSMLLH